MYIYIYGKIYRYHKDIKNNSYEGNANICFIISILYFAQQNNLFYNVIGWSYQRGDENLI